MPNHTDQITILLAEDDIDDQELLEEVFKDINPSIHLFCFTSSEKFLKHIEQLSGDKVPDMIVLDYNIPEANGAEILKRLNAKENYLPVVKLVWSTSDSALYEKNCFELGAKAYMVKPSNISDFREMAKKMLSYID